MASKSNNHPVDPVHPRSNNHQHHHHHHHVSPYYPDPLRHCNHDAIVVVVMVMVMVTVTMTMTLMVMLMMTALVGLLYSMAVGRLVGLYAYNGFTFPVNQLAITALRTRVRLLDTLTIG